MKPILISILPLFLMVSCDDRNNYVEYHSNGQTAWEGQYIDGKKTGQWIQSDSLGNQLAIFEYGNDTLRFRSYFSKGRLISKEEMRGDTIKHGITFTYHENGEVEGKMNFYENFQIGEQTFYFSNGAVASTYYQTTKGVTELYQYYENGNLFVYAKNFSDGEVNFHDSLGNRTYDLLYENGVIVDTLKSY